MASEICYLLVFIMYIIPGSTTLCVREGDCVVLRCPPIQCNNQPNENIELDEYGCVPTKTSQQLGAIHVIRWTHMEHNISTIRKERKNWPIVVNGKFKGNTEILQNGDLKIPRTNVDFSGTYSCDVYYSNPQDARSTMSSPPIRLNVVPESDPSPVCEPEKNCVAADIKQEGEGLSKKVSSALIVIGGIFGGILLLFTALCLYSQRNKKKNTNNDTYNSVGISSPNSTPSARPDSSVAHPYYIPAYYGDNGSGVYDVINDTNTGIYPKPNPAEIERQDSGIEEDKNSEADRSSFTNKKW